MIIIIIIIIMIIIIKQKSIISNKLASAWDMVTKTKRLII